MSGELSPEQHSFIRNIITAADKMNDLISSLLDISKLEAGKINVNKQSVNASKLLEVSYKEHLHLADEKKLNVQVRMPKKDIIVSSDPLLLGEVYSNLISNAIKYTPAGGNIGIKLKLARTKMHFCVSDSGYGIPKELQGRIFRKFYRAENIRSIETDGNGLGLYMVKKISDEMNGKLWFTSKENIGSAFHFSIPI
jgi:signal transduction histidine kinase